MRIAYICRGSGQPFGALRKFFVPIRPHLLNDALREFCATQRCFARPQWRQMAHWIGPGANVADSTHWSISSMYLPDVGATPRKRDPLAFVIAPEFEATKQPALGESTHVGSTVSGAVALSPSRARRENRRRVMSVRFSLSLSMWAV
jgi:hypothetical protein